MTDGEPRKGRCPFPVHLAAFSFDDNCKSCRGTGFLEFRSWTPEDLDQLRALWSDRNLTDIACRLERCEQDVREEAARKGLRERPAAPSFVSTIRPMREDPIFGRNAAAEEWGR